MTTFTTEDRILAEKDGSLTVNVEPIPFAGWVSTSPPHIVNSGASVMNNEPVAWMLTLPDGTHDWILDGNGCEGYIPLYTHPAKAEDEGKVCARCGAIAYDPVITQTAKTLTDEEIWEIFQETQHHAMDFARAILRKAQEK